jgi:hypothetical protein
VRDVRTVRLYNRVVVAEVRHAFASFTVRTRSSMRCTTNEELTESILRSLEHVRVIA